MPLETPVGPLRERNAAVPDQRPGLPRLSSAALLAGQREIVIVHGAREYRLRVTQSGKLILTA